MAGSFLKKAWGKIADGFRNEWSLFRRQYARIFAIVALALVAAAVIGYFYFASHPDKSKDALTALNKIVLAKVSRQMSGPALAWAIFWNNLRASMIAVIMGLIPFACLAAWLPVVNGGALGLLVFALRARGMSIPLLFLVDLAPHGIFEIAGWLYASCLGVYFSLNFVRRLLAPPPIAPTLLQITGKESESGAARIPPGQTETPLIHQVLTSFARVVVPLLIIAALIEAFITPLLHKAIFGVGPR